MKTSIFGTLDGQSVPLFELENAAGMRVKVTSYGATVTSISLPDGPSGRREMACGFDSLEGYFSDAYRSNAPYFGCTVGRYASRIKDGKFELGGEVFTLAINDGSNHLHGGLVGFDKRIWEAVPQGDDAIKFTLDSPDMEEGYPGNLTVSVTYRLTDDNALVIEYSGVTDAATPLSLTNHTYFNLSGFKDTIHEHRAEIKAAEILEPDHTNIPVGEVGSVANTPADLRQPKRLGDCFESLTTGFEHFYRLPQTMGELTSVARFEHPASGTTLEVSTTEPGALFYTGYFTSDDLKRENGDQFGRYRAFCFETSRYPNGPNLDGVTDAILEPGQQYTSKTVYQFFV